ncbi:hypothetical protein M422DRAFT_45130 [Sphaerobolus stellatus SS14]|nr:hypothetical protein M422DRAFT_45130 [Sphaerobolus stellatus SS14]
MSFLLANFYIGFVYDYGILHSCPTTSNLIHKADSDLKLIGVWDILNMEGMPLGAGAVKDTAVIARITCTQSTRQKLHERISRYKSLAAIGVTKFILEPLIEAPSSNLSTFLLSRKRALSDTSTYERQTKRVQVGRDQTTDDHLNDIDIPSNVESEKVVNYQVLTPIDNDPTASDSGPRTPQTHAISLDDPTSFFAEDVLSTNPDGSFISWRSSTPISDRFELPESDSTHLPGFDSLSASAPPRFSGHRKDDPIPVKDDFDERIKDLEEKYWKEREKRRQETSSFASILQSRIHELNEMARDLDQSKSSLSNASAERDSSAHVLMDLRRSYFKLWIAVLQLESRNASLSNNIGKLNTQVSQMSNRNASLTLDLTNEQEAVRRLGSQNASLSKDKVGFNAQSSQAQLKSDKDALQQQVKALHQEKEDVTKQIGLLSHAQFMHKQELQNLKFLMLLSQRRNISRNRTP